MNRDYINVVIGLLLTVAGHAQQWTTQAGESPAGIQGIYSITPQAIIANGEKMFLLSQDGGNHWATAAMDSKDYQMLIKPSFVSSSVGFSGTYINTLNAAQYIVPVPVLLKTTDGGRSWHAETTAGLSKLSRPEFIHFFNANEGILAGSSTDESIILYKTVDGGLSWQQKFAPADLFGVLDGQFIDASTGYLITWGNVLKTMNAGETWSVQTPDVDAENYENIQRVSFSSATEGWVAGNNALLKTSDGGAHWTSVTNAGFQPGETIQGIHFFSAAQGILASAQGELRYTEDGGTTWASRRVGGINGTLTDLIFVDNQTGYAAAQYTDLVARTDNRGVTWQNKYTTPPVSSSLYDITFSGLDKGWAVGALGLMMSTQDGGTHWAEVANPAQDMGYDLYTITPQNEETIWAGGMDNTLLRSTDAGQTWAIQADIPQFYNAFRDLHFIKGTSTGWAVGEGFRIMKYDGTTWTLHSRAGEKFLSLEAVFFVNPSTGWIVGEGGTVLKTTDGGVTWNNVNIGGVLRKLNDVWFVNENTGWIVGDNDYILKTVDGGLNWHQQNLPPSFVGNMEAVYFSSPHRGWVAGSDEHRGAIYSTVDGGNEWKRVLPYFGSEMYGMHFHDLNHGWVVSGNLFGDPGNIFRYTANDTGNGDASPAIRTIDFEPITDTLFNFNLARHALIDSTKFGGKFIGRNATGTEEFGEKYQIEGEAWVTGVISYHSGTVAHPKKIAEFNVFNVDADGMPDRKLRRKDVYFGDIDLGKEAMVTVFDKPVAVRDSFFVSFNLTDYSHGGFEGDVLGVLHTSNNTRPRDDIASRNTIRIHDHATRTWRSARELITTQGYSGYFALFPIIQYKLSSDATLKSLSASAGTFAPLFKPSVFNYTVHLPYGATAVPVLTYAANHSAATVTYTPAQSLTGQQSQRTASIAVAAADGSTNTYTVVFDVAEEGLDTLKNHAPTAPLEVMKYNKAQGWGYLLGHNYMFRQQYAEKYFIQGKAEVSGVITHLKGRYAHADTLSEFNVFNVTANHIPGERLGGRKVPYKDLVLDGGPTTVVFDRAIAVADSFYVSFNLFDYAHGGYEGDTIGMYMSRPGSRLVADFAVKGRNVVQRHNHEFTDWVDFRTQNFTPYAVHFALYPIVKFTDDDVPTGTGEQYVEHAGLRLFPAYPNPANTVLNLNYSLSLPAQVAVDILDVRGAPITQIDLGVKGSGLQHDTLDVTLLPAGVYIYVLRAGRASLAAKIVITH